jgi:PAS domain S-box-containing protein
VRRDGSRVPVLLTDTMMPGDSNDILAFVLDITARRHAEEALRKSEFHLARAQQMAHLGSWSWDIAADRLYWSDETYRLFGLQPGELVAPHRDFLGVVHPEDRPRVEKAVQEALAHGPYQLDFRIVRRGGEERYVHSEGQTTFDQDDHPVRMEGSVQDITERKRAEETLRQALLDVQQRCAEISALMTCTRAVLECPDLVSAARTVFNTCRELLGAQAGYVAVLTPDGENNKVLFLEPGGLSCTVDPSLAMPVRGFRAEAYHRGRVVYENDFANSPWTGLLPPGHVRLENVLFAPLVIDGRTIGLLGLGNKPGGFTDHDATLATTFGELVAIALRNSRTLDSLRELNATLESKVAQRTAELEHRAKQLQKLTLELSQAEDRERRRIAAILHEDLQQQIAGARFHLNLLKGRVKLESAQEVVTRVEEMLKEAIEKSRCLSHDLSPAVLHMNDLREVLQWLANRVRAQQGLTVRVDVASVATLHSEALTMFLFRAAQEMLFNVVKHSGVNEAALRVRRQGRYVCLRISDRGRGFDPQELRKTAGFGLLSIRERVELLGGRMKIKSAQGQGSTFSIVVPDGEKPEDRGQKTEDGGQKVDKALPSPGLRRP